MSAAIYSEAKSEYTKQLVFNFQPVLLRFFLDRYAESKASSNVTTKVKSALSEFQASLSQIPEWNLDKVRKETTTLLENVHCDYIDDLITAVFIAHTKILSAIRLNVKPRRHIQITVPKPDHFMHRCLSECSRLMWSNVYLFNDSVSTLDSQKNMTEVNHFLEEGILQAIRNLLPVKSILRENLQEDETDNIQITTGLESPTAATAAAVATVPNLTISDEVKVEPKVEVEAEEVKVQPKALEVKEVKTEEVKFNPELKLEEPKTLSDTLVIDTEKTVGFTGMDSLFGESGDAELRPMIEEGDNDLKILGESEALDLDEIEDLNLEPVTPIPLSADDYEAL